MRFTKNNRQQVLDNNEGFSTETSYRGSNYREHRTYTIENGMLVIRSTGKTSWSDSHFDETYTYDADAEETKRFLREFRNLLILNEDNESDEDD